jgi:hypothetical protein
LVDHVDVRGPSVLDIVTNVAGESPLAGTEKVGSWPIRAAW